MLCREVGGGGREVGGVTVRSLEQSGDFPPSLRSSLSSSVKLVSDPFRSFPSPSVVEPSLFSFLAFILLFWNQILICLSESPRWWAISILLLRVRYLLKWNSWKGYVLESISTPRTGGINVG